MQQVITVMQSIHMGYVISGSGPPIDPGGPGICPALSNGCYATASVPYKTQRISKYEAHAGDTARMVQAAQPVHAVSDLSQTNKLPALHAIYSAIGTRHSCGTEY